MYCWNIEHSMLFEFVKEFINTGYWMQQKESEFKLLLIFAAYWLLYVLLAFASKFCSLIKSQTQNQNMLLHVCTNGKCLLFPLSPLTGIVTQTESKFCRVFTFLLQMVSVKCNHWILQNKLKKCTTFCHIETRVLQYFVTQGKLIV